MTVWPTLNIINLIKKTISEIENRKVAMMLWQHLILSATPTARSRTRVWRWREPLLCTHLEYNKVLKKNKMNFLIMLIFTFNSFFEIRTFKIAFLFFKCPLFKLLQGELSELMNISITSPPTSLQRLSWCNAVWFYNKTILRRSNRCKTQFFYSKRIFLKKYLLFPAFLRF